MTDQERFEAIWRGILKYEDHLPCPAQPAPKPAIEKIEIS